MTDDELLDLCAKLAIEAGNAILAVRARGFDVTRKADYSPVTEADQEAEAIILAGLRAATPDIPVVAEEEIAGGHIAKVENAFWLVDPLDGTREFTAGRDEFTVNIALIRDQRPVLGVVYVPPTQELFLGIVGRGAAKRKGTAREVITARKPPPEGLTVLASRSHANESALNDFLKGRKVAKLANYGSSLKFCRMAEGLADLYPRHGRTMEWDTAAAQAVLEAAGGAVLVMGGPGDGQPLRYAKPGWENPHFYATGAQPGPATALPPEVGGKEGPEPTRYGDWAHKGRVSDF